jgi:hypothetical protein
MLTVCGTSMTYAKACTRRAWGQVAYPQAAVLAGVAHHDGTLSSSWCGRDARDDLTVHRLARRFCVLLIVELHEGVPQRGHARGGGARDVYPVDLAGLDAHLRPGLSVPRKVAFESGCAVAGCKVGRKIRRWLEDETASWLGRTYRS